MLAYIFAMIAHAPFLMSFVRMYWHDTEKRRKIFYEVSLRVWLLAALVDIWVVLNLLPETHELC